MSSSSLLEPLSYSNVMGDIDGESESPEVTLARFASSNTARAGRYFGHVRRERKAGGDHVGVAKHLMYDIIPLLSDEACGRTSVYVKGMRVDGNYTSKKLAGRLFVTTVTGGVFKVPLGTERDVLPAGGVHDSIMLVLSRKAGKVLESGVWPEELIPKPERLNEAIEYCTRLRSCLRESLSKTQYSRLLGKSFTARSAFGEVVVLVTRLFMLQDVALYHLVDNADAFVGAYCGMAGKRRELAGYLTRSSHLRREEPGPHAWSLGTMSQVMQCTGVSIRISDFLSDYNKYARHTIPVYARDVVRRALSVDVSDELMIHTTEVMPMDHEHYSVYLVRMLSLLEYLRNVPQSDATTSALVEARIVVKRAIAIHTTGLYKYNMTWCDSGWQFGQFMDV